MKALPQPKGVDTSLMSTAESDKHYPSAKQATNKYKTQEEFKKKVDLTSTSTPTRLYTQQYGAILRGKIRGSAHSNQAEFLLDNLAGTGSQIIHKKEQAPLFRPEDNIQWAHGTPNNSDFYQSRVNPAMAMNNVKPWEEERVGPGLGQGFTTEGSGGFNSGMESRNSWLPKNVNELRTLTNPKVTYGLKDMKDQPILILRTGEV